MNDLKLAVRMLVKNPGFTSVAVLTLALGIGATTTVFSIVNGVLLRPLDFPGSERIVHLWESDPAQGMDRQNTSPANFLDWRREAKSFEAISFTAEYGGQATRSFIHNEDGESQRLTGRFITTNYFAVYGLKPTLGRAFLPEEEAPGAPRLTVISHRLWQQLYQGRADVVGQTITLENNGRHPYEIIGVGPKGFHLHGADVWVSSAHLTRPMTRRGGAMLHAVARLKPGVTIARARAEMNAIQAAIHAEFGHLGKDHPHLRVGSGIDIVPALEAEVGHVRASLLIFSGAVALVLLIACANIANLQLARALSRRREVALRAALGAGRWRIARQLLCESLVLAVCGGATGVLLAHWGLKLIVAFSAGSIPRLELVQLDGRALLFALAASLATGLIFGIIPAWRASHADLNSALKDGSSQTAGGLSHRHLHGAFTVAQIALALTLLIGAGLLLRSFHLMQSVAMGFDTDEILTVDVTMTGASYEKMEQRRSFIRRVLENLRASPGVEAASFVSMIPDRLSGWPTRYARTDRPIPPFNQQPIVNVRTCGPDFARTNGIRLLRGREFTAADTAQSRKVVLINEAFADLVYPGEDPVGKILDCRQKREIVGVLANVKNSGFGDKTRPKVYNAHEQWDFNSGFLSVRAKSDPMALVPLVTDEVARVNPKQPLKYFNTIRQYLDRRTARPRDRASVPSCSASSP